MSFRFLYHYNLLICKSISLLFCCYFLTLHTVAAKETVNKESDILRFAVIGISGQQREVLLSLAYDFEQINKSTYIRYVFLEDATLKQEIHDWMRGKNDIDLVLWQAGERLFQFVRKNQVEQLDDFWEQHDLDQNYPSSIKPLIQSDGHTYGVPISYYNWGFYYNAALFKKLDILPPKNWTELLKVVEIFEKEKINPISISSKEKWPVSAWFEYLNLRINGLEFHQKLMRGQVAFDTKEVAKVLNHWQQILNTAKYKQEHKVLLWRDALPDLLREKSGMALMGNFMTQLLPEHLDDKMGYFPFPEINNDMPHYELAPTDVLMIPTTAKNKALAYQYMAFLVEPKNQTFLNKGFKQFAVHKKSNNSSRTIMKQGLANLLSAQGLTQYFDRETSETLSSELFDIWIEFIDSRDVQGTMIKMEAARKRYLETLLSE